MGRDNDRPSDPQTVFDTFLDRIEGGEDVDFEAFCGEHPALQDELRRLHDEWIQLEDLVGEVRDQFIPEDDVTPTFDSGDVRGDILERLSSRGHRPDRYSIKGKVGEGGMGAVFRVWDRDLKRHLAMKVILGKDSATTAAAKSPQSSGMLWRFLDEAQITSQLEHPGIVPIHDIGLDARGRVYFTMPLVRGMTLKQVFAELEASRSGEDGASEWTETKALRSILRACEAVAYAHAKQVIHRDLKPSNIMVGRFGETYVMDWGVAKLLGRVDHCDLRVKDVEAETLSSVSTERAERSDEEALDQPLVTMDGHVIGTPSYMSIEQARGEVEAIGPCSDVYAMGAILYHLLVGHMPYVPKGVTMTQRTVLAQVLLGPPPSPDRLRDGIPPELVSICERSMARERDERYPDMREMAADLQAYLDNRVVRAHRTGAGVEFRKWVSRNRGMAMSLGLALFLLIGGLGFIAHTQNRARGELAMAKDAADEARRTAEDNAREAEDALAIVKAQHDEILALSDGKRLRDLIIQEQTLWPAHPSNIASMEVWLEEAQDLVSRVPRHQEILWRLRRTTLTSDADPGEREAIDRLIEERGRLAAVEGQERESLLESVASLETELLERPWTFQSTDRSWQHETLVQLVADLEGFGTSQKREACIEGVRQRLTLARSLRAAEEEYEDRWNECLDSLADEGDSPAYYGMEIEPQVGLVPIGRDPVSELWEFADLQTGTVPQRNEEGFLEMSEESAVVFILIPGGESLLGAQSEDPDGENYDADAREDESPIRAIELDAFFISKYEMTQGQWIRVTGHNPSWHKSGPGGCGEDHTLLAPVEQVSWDDCTREFGRLGFMIPTEAQWEYAARAGTATAYWTGAGKETIEGAGNVADQAMKRAGNPDDWAYEPFDDGNSVHGEIGEYEANPFGLHDTIGNLVEWCRETYAPYEEVMPREGDGFMEMAGSGFRVVRGGDFYNTARFARSARRVRYDSNHRHTALGCRPARALVE